MGRTSQPRMTQATQLVLRALLDDAAREMYGLELVAAAGLPTGTIHPILARLEGLGWVVSRWEELDPREAGRPRRRYYKLTDDGAVGAVRALNRVPSPRGGAGQWQPGTADGWA